ncbi:MAG: class I SAM-dependent methyltransferase [Caulobacteraceae bacterium]
MSDLASLLEDAERRPLVGWDFSYDGRIASRAPWDFEAIADEEARRSPDLLDMGTGGGEWLSRRPFPKGRTVATEAWPPNVPVARARLAPLGVKVVAVEGAPDNADQAHAPSLPPLPFADGSFHLVTNRHESFVASEVTRILTPGGRFITQQIASDFAEPMRELLKAPKLPPAPAWTLAEARSQLERAGLEVLRVGDGAAEASFADVGALAWYLLHVPWTMPDFSIPEYRERLERLHATGPITVRQPMFWLSAQRREES